MKIGLLLPSILMTSRFEDRIFAPKDLFVSLVNGLVKLGNDVTVYSSSNTVTTANLISSDSVLEKMDLTSVKDMMKDPKLIPVLSSLRSTYEYEIDLVEKAFLHAKKEKIDIMHIYLIPNANYFFNYFDIPTIFTLHDPVPPKGSLEKLRFEGLSKFDFVTISNSQKKDYQKEFNIKNFYTVYHGIGIQDNKFFENPIDDYFTTIGRFIPQKGITDAIEVCVRKKQTLKIASSDNYKQTEYYKNHIAPLLNTPYVQLSGLASAKQKEELLGNAKAFLFPIKWEEPFGIVMVESMRHGTPVIAYAQGSVPEIIKDGETGFIINLSEYDKRGDFIIKKTGQEGLAEAIERINSMPKKEYIEMRKNSRIHVEENFSVEKMVEGYENVYKKILGNGLS